MKQAADDAASKTTNSSKRTSSEPLVALSQSAMQLTSSADHFPCMQQECLDQKFVVFASEMDLRAHVVSTVSLLRRSKRKNSVCSTAETCQLETELRLDSSPSTSSREGEKVVHLPRLGAHLDKVGDST
jgi:hypothetical protein